ncbi:MAG: hypothetical protein ACO262_09565, partial [Vulcanococcus sp.]
MNALTAMRLWRTGRSQSSRLSSWASIRSIGFGRSTSTGGCIEALFQLDFQLADHTPDEQAIVIGCDLS